MKLYLNLTSTIILVHVFFLRKVTADSFDNWTKAMDAYFDDRIAKDLYKVYVDIKSEMDFFNAKFKRLKDDIDYQVVFTRDLMKQVGTDLSNRTSNLSKEMNTFPKAIDQMNKEFSHLKDSIVELPRKQPCYSKMAPSIDSVKERGLDLLNKSIEFNENSKLMTSNMVRITDQMGVIANGIKGKEMEDILNKFQEKVEAKTNQTTREYTANVHKIMVGLEGRMNSLNVHDQRSPSIANGYKVEAQKQLELIRSKTLVDLQDELQFVVKSLQEVQFSAGDMSYAYSMLLQKAEFMVDDIDYVYDNGVWQSQVGGYKINKMAGLTVTHSDGTKLDSSEYIPAYTLGENEEIYSIAQAGMDLIILIIGTDEPTDEEKNGGKEPEKYTRKIFKMFVDDSNDWVYMWVYRNGAVVQENKYIYNYDGEKC